MSFQILRDIRTSFQSDEEVPWGDIKNFARKGG